MTGVSGANSDTPFSTGAKLVESGSDDPSLTGVSVCTSKVSNLYSVTTGATPSFKSSGVKSSSSASVLTFVYFPLVTPLTLAANAEAPKAGNRIGDAAIAPTATAPVFRAEPAFDFQFLTFD